MTGTAEHQPAHELRVGNVYPCHGGKKTRYWIVIGLSERAVHMVGINDAGDITSTANYGAHVFNGRHAGFKQRPVLGFCEWASEMAFTIRWSEA